MSHPRRVLFSVTAVAFLQFGQVASFAPAITWGAHRNVAIISHNRLFSTAGESEVEGLLRRARELREQAEADEVSLRSESFSKKAAKDLQTDQMIDKIFPLNCKDACTQETADQIIACKASADFLSRVIERLHEREIAARGLSHVESASQSNANFEVVSGKVNQVELSRVEGLIQRLIDAVGIVDEKNVQQHFQTTGQQKMQLSHAETEHWHTGELTKILKSKAKNLGREHEDQFLKRLKSFQEAARIKKDDSNKSKK